MGYGGGKMRKSILIVVLALMLVGVVGGTSYVASWAAEESQLIEEHVYGGMPSPSAPNILVRNAYVISYHCERRGPNWVAYHLTPDYLTTPPREGAFDDFRDDPDLACEPSEDEYRSSGYDRGHLVPYAVSGGDRDGDGLYAWEDPDDAETVYQVNYMSNIAPQDDSFNRSGLWRELERWVQNDALKELGELWVIAGCIFGAGQVERIGPHRDIHVPAMFYKIVIQKPSDPSGDAKVLAFLFPHQRQSHGDKEDFLVSVDIVEALAGFDFFRAPDDGIDEDLETQDTWGFWDGFLEETGRTDVGEPPACEQLCQECLHRLNEVVTASDLEACPDIGETLAKRIIDYRPYEPSVCTVEGVKRELQRVPYVGEVRSDSVVKCICEEFYENCK